MMKVVTVLGTRPEIIRLSRILPLLDQHCRHVLVHTGQNFEPPLHDVFFDELRLRRPDHQLDCRSATPMEQIGKILCACEGLFQEEQPDRLLILGDTNSGLCALVAKRMGIPVFHMEAGNRCYDDRVPEEVNRRVIDHCSDVLLPYTERSRANLLREGCAADRIFVVGNPIHEVLVHHAAEIAASTILGRLGLEPGGYFLVTLHRAENVDVPLRLAGFIDGLARLLAEHDLPIVCSLHPRTRGQLLRQGQAFTDGVRTVSPLGLFDFVRLEQNARCVLSDSGTVQEECCLFQVPNVTLRDVTERPETVEAGSSILSGADPGAIVDAVRLALAQPPAWTPPAEYLATNVSSTVAKIVLGFTHRA